LLPNSAEIQYFLEVVTTLNISRAAERLGITQPTLSLSVQRLEASLGTALLIRSKTGVRLTKAGTKFAVQAKNLLEQWEKIRSDTLSEETEVKGLVSVGFHPSVALYSVEGFLPSLMTKYPDLQLRLHHDLSRKITERVISFEIDCAIVVNPVAHPDLRIMQLCSDEVLFWRCSENFSNSVKDVLICDPDLLQSKALMAKAKKLSGEFKFRRMLTSSSLEVCAKLAASGAGVAILPSRVARLEPSYRLKPLVTNGPVFEDKVCLIYRPDAQGSLAFKTVMRAIAASFKLAK
jgi:DNA-binding transcriptional LysR family regulator